MSKPLPSDNVDQAEEATWLQAAQFDLDAFAPFYQRYADRVYAYCRRRVDSVSEAEDLTSVIFARAMNAIGSYRGGSPGAWLFQIAHNTLANHYRAKRPQLPLHEAEDLLTRALAQPDPMDRIVERETVEAVEALVQALPADQQNLLLLKIVAGLSANEIGEVVNKRAGAVRIELHRIFKRLRRAYETRWPVEEDQP